MFSVNILIVVLLAYSAVAQESDYIVVGGGTSGIPLAARLADFWNVALVEAGVRYETSYPLAKTPGADVLPVGSDPDTANPADWGFVTEPFPGANGRKVHISRGKCLWSAFNFMIYQRPTRQSLDLWAEQVNDTSYRFDNFTPPNIDARFENASVLYNVDAFAPLGGPLEVTYPNYAQHFSSWLEGGFEEIDIPKAVDFNSGKLDVYQYASTTIRPRDQHRSSFESSFLEHPIPSLTIFKDTLAKMVISMRSITPSRREIILAAGVFQSPQLLMVSGIGPAEHLQNHGIKVLVDLPGVGQNLMGHPFIGPSYRVNIETLTRVATDIVYLASQYLRWARHQLGPCTSLVADFLAWEKIPYSLRRHFSEETLETLSEFPDDWPEVKYMSAPGFLGNISKLKSDQPDDGYQYVSIIGVLVAPTSRGTVTLRTADTTDLPLINLNWLDTKSDQEVAVAMFKRMREVFASPAMRRVVIGEEYFPGKQVQSNEDILEYIRENVMILWHPSRTCKMGTADDPEAVVDSRARVFGVNHLRVVDASAIPFLPPGHPQSTCYMLAEKIAYDIIHNGAEVPDETRLD
ncbi:GMC oxidoreductase [Aspergillus pseudoustus]|uniref:GMC oxidoreductase n=1 Tax=Aspergillus pseudoustus TaxID=1810923 RepID=A0ABR4K1K2_9EURO